MKTSDQYKVHHCKTTRLMDILKLKGRDTRILGQVSRRKGYEDKDNITGLVKMIKILTNIDVH